MCAVIDRAYSNIDWMVRARSLASRLEAISRRYLGRPYIRNPLIGSREIPEVLVTHDKGFDCVTFIETVVARAGVSGSREYREQLRRIRYQNGKIGWKQRNHYMTQWIQNNQRSGFVRSVKFDIRQNSKDRVLNLISGLPAVRQKFSCIPKRALARAVRDIHTGDLIFFASARPHLDVFHCGILIRDGERLLLRHASRSHGGVVEQELDSFMKANRMAGVIVVRPADPAASSARAN